MCTWRRTWEGCVTWIHMSNTVTELHCPAASVCFEVASHSRQWTFNKPTHDKHVTLYEYIHIYIYSFYSCAISKSCQTQPKLLTASCAMGSVRSMRSVKLICLWLSLWLGLAFLAPRIPAAPVRSPAVLARAKSLDRYVPPMLRQRLGDGALVSTLIQNCAWQL